MGEFLVETALRHGSYLHILSANDAMYQRNEVEVQHGKVVDKSENYIYIERPIKNQ